MEGGEANQHEAERLFHEENLDILDAVKSGKALSDQDKERFRRRMIAWLESQTAFVAGRKALFEEEILPFPPETHDAIRKLFSKFDETVAMSQETAERGKKLSCEELLVEMGYEVSE